MNNTEKVGKISSLRVKLETLSSDEARKMVEEQGLENSFVRIDF